MINKREPYTAATPTERNKGETNPAPLRKPTPSRVAKCARPRPTEQEKHTEAQREKARTSPLIHIEKISIERETLKRKKTGQTGDETVEELRFCDDAVSRRSGSPSARMSSRSELLAISILHLLPVWSCSAYLLPNISKKRQKERIRERRQRKNCLVQYGETKKGLSEDHNKRS